METLSVRISCADALKACFAILSAKAQTFYQSCTKNNERKCKGAM
jgi:hypothetical protein